MHDVLVDIRRDSPTFGRQQAFLLDDNDFRHLYVPPGFLHGFQALTATADVCYRIDRPHDPSENLAVAYNDPDLGDRLAAAGHGRLAAGRERPQLGLTLLKHLP